MAKSKEPRSPESKEARPPEPNRLDPLSEPTTNRRVWGAYLAAGYTRATFARELKMQYSALDRWDTGKRAISLEGLIKVCKTLGYSLDAMVYGHKIPAENRRREQRLTQEAIRSLLYEVGASDDQTEGLGIFLARPDGQLTVVTRSWLLNFIEAYEAARRDGAEQGAAIDIAKKYAANARALTEAAAMRVRPANSGLVAEVKALAESAKLNNVDSAAKPNRVASSAKPKRQRTVTKLIDRPRRH